MQFGHLNLHSAIRVKNVPQGKHAWYNKDLLPTKNVERTWGTVNYLFFYFTTSLTPSSYTLGSTLVSMGLLWWHGMICAVVGSIFLTVILVLNSRGPSVYHMGFPTIIRAASGMYGSYFFIFVRISVAIIYFSIQTYFAGRLMSVTLRCIFGHRWTEIPNKLPLSSKITSQNLLAFFIIWIIQGPMMFLHPKVQRHLYTVKFIITCATLFGVMGYCIRKAGGTLGTPESLASNKVHGEQLAWGIITGINAIMGALCPILINAGDVVRYAKRPRDAAWIQSFGVLFSKVLITFFGCATTSAARVFLGKTFWNPWDLYEALLDYQWTASMRTAMFFASLSMTFALLVVNLGTNCLPVGADASGMFPKYVTIVRGQVVCWIICPLLFPWKIISDGTKFVAFLGSYTTMLCPIAAVMIYDYFVVRKGNYHIPSFYNSNKTSVYWYNKYGVNFRAFGAWCVGVGLTIHGVANAISAGTVGIASTRMYSLGFLLSFLSAFLSFWLLNLAFPLKESLPNDIDIKSVRFEEFAKTDGYLEGESLDTILGDLSTVELLDVSDNSGVASKVEVSCAIDKV